MIRTICRAALFIPALICCPNPVAGQVRLTLREARANQPERIEVTGLPAGERDRFAQATTDEQRREIFAVRVVRAQVTSTAPLLGSFQTTNSGVAFLPRFPLRRGVRYRATWTDSNKRTFDKVFLRPVLDKTPPKVTHIYPTQDVLPENQLKFYIHFSKPMRQGGAYAHVKLIDKTTGKEVQTPFLELAEELWDSSGMRFTLYFDPGRIKRGLQPRQLFGPTLEAGKRYELVISKTWKGANASLPLAETYRKSFRAAEPDQTMPNHRMWMRLTAPRSGTREKINLLLDEPLDHAMLLRVLRVEDPDGKPVPGRPEVTRGETMWGFQPDEPWKAGIHTLKIDKTLEDRAGNSIGRPFEVDMIERNTERVVEETATLRFRVVEKRAANGK